MVLIEKVAFQTVMQFSMADKYPGVPVHPLPPIGDKGHRTEQLAIKCNENKVFFDLNNVVHKEFKAEAMNFKIHRHDDCLDALSQIVQFMGSSIQNVRVRRVKSPFML
jgi:phage terminase large subunit-like protein